MNIQDIQELHYITPIENVPSILEKGIYSHNLAHGQDLVKRDFSNQSVQGGRAQKVVPIRWPDGKARTIHDHVNLYFQSANSTLYARKDLKNLCILRIRSEVLKRKDALISSTNAAANEAVFKRVQDGGLSLLDKEILMGDSWHNKSASEEENKLRRKKRCAELLLPQKLHPSAIAGVFVPNLETRTFFMQTVNNDSPIPVDITPERFFQARNTTSKVSTLANQRFSKLVDFPPIPEPAKAKKIEPLPAGQKTLVGFFTKQVATASVAPPAANVPKLPDNITIKRGDLFSSHCKTSVNTINCVGVMGKGIAKEFKTRYPDMFKEYKALCKREVVKLGEPYHYSKGVSIINFPTKNHWRQDADIDAIKKGLEVLVAHAQEWKLESVAFPPLGCGNGNLKWKDIGPIMCQVLKDAPFMVEIYVPKDTPAAQTKASFLLGQK